MGNFAIRRTATSFLLSLTILGAAYTAPLHAQTRNTVNETINSLEAAANGHDLEAVLAFYGDRFTHSDGLTRELLATRLQDLWSRYSGVRYSIDVDHWEREGEQIIAETTTKISGSRYEGTRPIRLQSEIQSRQYIDRATQQIVRQEILNEQTLVFSGANPPTINVNLPQEINVGDEFDFDVIVQEPLQGDLLLGGALESPISYEEMVATNAFELELLQAGGIFKRGIAPDRPEERWFSAIVVRGDGMTLVTHRVKITDN